MDDIVGFEKQETGNELSGNDGKDETDGEDNALSLTRIAAESSGSATGE